MITFMFWLRFVSCFDLRVSYVDAIPNNIAYSLLPADSP